MGGDRDCSQLTGYSEPDATADSETGLATSFRQFEDWFNEFNG
jgi:hypothetical protein